MPSHPWTMAFNPSEHDPWGITPFYPDFGSIFIPNPLLDLAISLGLIRQPAGPFSDRPRILVNVGGGSSGGGGGNAFLERFNRNFTGGWGIDENNRLITPGLATGSTTPGKKPFSVFKDIADFYYENLGLPRTGEQSEEEFEAAWAKSQYWWNALHNFGCFMAKVAAFLYFAGPYIY